MAFDQTTAHFENFQNQFLLRLSTFLGFGFDYSLIQDQVISGHGIEVDTFLKTMTLREFFADVPSSGKVRE